MLGAIGTLIVGAVLSYFAPVFAYTIMSTAVSMATAMCYGQWGAVAISLGIGIVSIVLQGALQAVSKAWEASTGFLKTAIDKIGEGIARVTQGIRNVVDTVFNGVLTVYKHVVDGAKWIGSQIRNTWGRAGEAITNIFGGMVSSGITRYVAEEMDATSNWMAKIGIAFAGAAFLVPVAAFASPTFGASWCLNEEATYDSVHLINEMIFESFSQIASNETYKALEDTLGEMWYADLLRTSITSVMNAGFNILKNIVHAELGDIPEYAVGLRKAFLDEHNRYGNNSYKEIYDKDTGLVRFVLKDANGKILVTMEVNGDTVIESNYKNATKIESRLNDDGSLTVVDKWDIEMIEMADPGDFPFVLAGEIDPNMEITPTALLNNLQLAFSPHDYTSQMSTGKLFLDYLYDFAYTKTINYVANKFPSSISGYFSDYILSDTGGMHAFDSKRMYNIYIDLVNTLREDVSINKQFSYSINKYNMSEAVIEYAWGKIPYLGAVNIGALKPGEIGHSYNFLVQTRDDYYKLVSLNFNYGKFISPSGEEFYGCTFVDYTVIRSVSRDDIKFMDGFRYEEDSRVPWF